MSRFAGSEGRDAETSDLGIQASDLGCVGYSGTPPKRLRVGLCTCIHPHLLHKHTVSVCCVCLMCMHAVYVCMYVCMHACMYVCMHACMYACMHACMCACMYVCMYVCTYVCMYRHVYTHVYVCMPLETDLFGHHQKPWWQQLFCLSSTGPQSAGQQDAPRLHSTPGCWCYSQSLIMQGNPKKLEQGLMRISARI